MTVQGDPKPSRQFERDIRRMQRVIELVAKMDDSDKRFLAERLKEKEFRRWLQ